MVSVQPAQTSGPSYEQKTWAEHVFDPKREREPVIFEPWNLQSVPWGGEVTLRETGSTEPSPPFQVYARASLCDSPWLGQTPEEREEIKAHYRASRAEIARTILAESGPFHVARQRTIFGVCEKDPGMTLAEVMALLKAIHIYENARGGLTRPNPKALNTAQTYLDSDDNYGYEDNDFEEVIKAYESMRSQR